MHVEDEKIEKSDNVIMASELALPKPRTALAQLAETIVPTNSSRSDTIYLTIRADNSEVNVREFNAYLKLIDRTYGRLSPQGFLSYSHNPSSQLQVSFRQGSLLISLSEALSNPASVESVAVIGLILKYLPTILKESAGAYHKFEEGLTVRESRRQLRESFNQNQELTSLDNDKRNEIIAFLDSLFRQEHQQLPAAKRFALKYVREVTFRSLTAGEQAKQDEKDKAD